MEQTQPKKLTKITKVTLVIYCLIVAVCLIVFGTISGIKKDYSFLYGFLLCLGPSIVFVVVSLFFPLGQLVAAKAGKGVIAWSVIGYILKYGLVIGIPFIGVTHPDIFNKWVMLGTTLIAPITVIISKLIFANVVSKNAKNNQK